VGTTNGFRFVDRTTAAIAALAIAGLAILGLTVRNSLSESLTVRRSFLAPLTQHHRSYGLGNLAPIAVPSSDEPAAEAPAAIAPESHQRPAQVHEVALSSPARPPAQAHSDAVAPGSGNGGAAPSCHRVVTAKLHIALRRSTASAALAACLDLPASATLL